MSTTNQDTTECFHNPPYVDENPAYFVVDKSLNDEGTFDGVSYYKCKHCDREYACDVFTEEGKLFESKFNNLSSK